MKKLWNNNRILFFLLTILLVCFITIIIVAMSFFYSRNTSVYGDRINNISNYPVTNEVKDAFANGVKKDSSVKDVVYNIKVRTIYITISFDDKITLEKAQELIENNVDNLSEEILSYYDVEFILKSDKFTIIGAKNAVSDHVSWNNNRAVDEEED